MVKRCQIQLGPNNYRLRRISYKIPPIEKGKYRQHLFGGICWCLIAISVIAEIGDHKVICLSTAHPAKFPAIIQQALGCETLPEAATHPSIEQAKRQCQKGYTADHSHLEEALLHAMGSQWEQNQTIKTS